MPPSRKLKPRKIPRQARARETVEAILVAAAQVLRRHGYAGATTDRIAERAGVSVGSLYQYFPNKDAILVTLAERHVDAGFARVREMMEDPQGADTSLPALLERFVRGMLALHEHEPELHRVLFEEAPLPAALRRSLRRRENALAADVGELLRARSDVRMRDPDVGAHILVHTVEGLVHGFVLHPPDTFDAEDLTRELVVMLAGYLSA
jgi:AcrR family transcriptional regulator